MADVEIKWHDKELIAIIEQATPDALLAAAQTLVDVAASKAPQGPTGVLAASAYVANEKETTYKTNKLHNRQALVPPGGAVGGFAAFYARFLELGTKHAPARPFMRPAFDETKEQLGAQIVNEIGPKLNTARE